jgi:hypothetical protein
MVVKLLWPGISLSTISSGKILNTNSKKEAFRGFLFLYGGGLAAALWWILGATGCASIDSSDFRQVVYVRSSPPGAAILQNGEQIGVTPAYVKVKRSRHPELTLKYQDEEPYKIPLKTHYRWGDSFATNFVEYVFAPIGMGVDILTGAAWRIDDPPELHSPGAKGEIFSEEIHNVAIAPPVHKDSDLSDSLGRLEEAHLRESTSYHIFSYDQTEPLFTNQGSDMGLTAKLPERYRLFYESNADHIFWSQVTPWKDGYLVTGHMKSIYTDKEGPQISWEVSPQESQQSEPGLFSRYFHILPNTVFLNFAAFNTANFSTTLDIGGTDYKGNTLKGQSSFEQALEYISSLSLTHMDRPRSHVRGHWVFNFVPTLIVSDRLLAFDSYPALSGVKFERWYVSGGYGVEVGHQSRYGFFYLDLIPAVTWTQIKLETPDMDERVSNTTITLIGEVGYTYFFTRHLVGKLFTRTYTEDAALWQRVASDVTGRDVTVAAANSVMAGVSIGYYIPWSFNAGAWKIHDKM